MFLLLKSCSSDFNFFHLQLEGTFSFDTYVAPVSLDTIGGQSEGDHFTVTGWGTTSVSTRLELLPFLFFSIFSIIAKIMNYFSLVWWINFQHFAKSICSICHSRKLQRFLWIK